MRIRRGPAIIASATVFLGLTVGPAAAEDPQPAAFSKQQISWAPCEAGPPPPGFPPEQDRQRDIAAAEAAWAVSRQLLSDPSIGLVVLDELNIALKHGYLDLDQVLSDLQARPPMQHVVVTGRGAKPELIELADTVTEMGMIKHAFQAGIKAQKGVEL